MRCQGDCAQLISRAVSLQTDQRWFGSNGAGGVPFRQPDQEGRWVPAAMEDRQPPHGPERATMIPLTRCSPSRRAAASRLVAACIAAGLTLAGCDRQTAVTAPPSRLVRTEIVKLTQRRTSITLTGDVQARVLADLSFRVSGRVTERLVEVGAHVKAGQLLAKIDPAEQQADLDSAEAAVVAAESQVKVATSNFNRQQTLLSSGFTTRKCHA